MSHRLWSPWALLFLAASCCLTRARHAPPARAERDCGPPNPELEPLASLGQDPTPFTLQHQPSDSNLGGFTYRFEREVSGTTDALRGVSLVRGRPPLVVGDHGTVLVRNAKSGWARETTGTEQNLYAIVNAPLVRNDLTDLTAPYVAVGAGGTALARDSAGLWHAEDTGVASDLFGLWHRGTSTIAVGARGTMLERSQDGGWRQVATRTQADLHAVGPCGQHTCAVGAGGTIVDCVQRGKDLVCIPRRPVTDGTLFAVSDRDILVGERAWLAAVPPKDREDSPPVEWTRWRHEDASVRENDALAVADNHYLGIGQTLVTGRKGAIWLVDDQVLTQRPLSRVEARFDEDFHGAAFNLVDGFLVGANGTIVKLGIHGFRHMKLCFGGQRTGARRSLA